MLCWLPSTCELWMLMRGHTELKNQWPRIQLICWALGLHLDNQQQKDSPLKPRGLVGDWAREQHGIQWQWSIIMITMSGAHFSPSSRLFCLSCLVWRLFSSLLFSLCVLISVFLNSTQFNERKERGSDRESLKPLFLFIFKKFWGFWNFVEPSIRATPQIPASVHHLYYRFFCFFFV